MHLKRKRDPKNAMTMTTAVDIPPPLPPPFTDEVLPTETTAMPIKRALVWFRSDLRIHNNPALSSASQYLQDGGNDNNNELLTLYLINSEDFKRHDTSPSKVDLILRTLNTLQRRLKETYSIPLFVKTLDSTHTYAHESVTDFTHYYHHHQQQHQSTLQQKKALAESREKLADYIVAFCKSLDITKVFYNKEYEVDESARDEIINQKLKDQNIEFEAFEDQCLIPPGSILSQQGTPYKKFAPFKQAWIEALKQNKPKHTSVLLPTLRSNPQKWTHEVVMIDAIPKKLKDIEEMNPELTLVVRQDWSDKEESILERLKAIIASKTLTDYKKSRDYPCLLDGTTRLSAYLAIGSLSIRTIVHELALTYPSLYKGGGVSESSGPSIFLSELCWRDFYRHVLALFPRVSRHMPFQQSTEKIVWRTDQKAMEDFQAWKMGKTGFPIVDAGMRQLLHTGWMHNRLRMIVASFLTKDLLIDWRLGEKYFSQNLVDGDLASNNGGWQWSASTGTDAQPYFRVFNPTTQSLRFDPNGEYIRRWVPELAHLKGKEIHSPAQLLPPSDWEVLSKVYPAPILDHAMARIRAIKAFKGF